MTSPKPQSVNRSITKNKVLVVVAHADDEAIGCGGTLLKHRDAGDEIQIIYMTNGVGARAVEIDINSIEERMKSQKSACEQLSVKHFYNYDFPDNRMDQVALIEVTQSIESVICSYQPNIVYTHHGGDLNIDHRIVHQAVMTACRPQPRFSVTKILAFEVNSSTEWSTSSIGATFSPNYFVDISKQTAEKSLLLSYYQQEMKAYPHNRSIKAIEALNSNRGCQIGVNSAEGFMLIRAIN